MSRMKKIFIAILSLLVINGYSQGINYKLYAIKCNTNGSIDSIYIKMFTDSLFINGSFVQFSREHFVGLFDPNYPNGFENYVQRADGIWININCFVNNATIVPTTVQTALDSKSPTSHTHTYSSLTSKPTTLSGYGITDAAALSHTHAYNSLTGLPTLFTQSNADALYSVLAHTHTFSSLTSKPTTLSGYGITDASASSHTHAYSSLTSIPSTFTPSAHTHAESEITGLVADLTAKQATLVSGSNIKTVNGGTVLGSGDITTTRKVAQADIASTANATAATTLFTPTVDGFYRVAIYLKITTTGTSPVAGPVTITYTSADGSVAQSHVMLLQSVTGTVVTTTVNNSTTTGTVNGSMVIYAKSGVAIQYAIAVSGTFGAGRYTAHLFCEQL